MQRHRRMRPFLAAPALLACLLSGGSRAEAAETGTGVAPPAESQVPSDIDTDLVIYDEGGRQVALGAQSRPE